jgi:hypothetical protein
MRKISPRRSSDAVGKNATGEFDQKESQAWSRPLANVAAKAHLSNGLARKPPSTSEPAVLVGSVNVEENDHVKARY